MIHTYGSYAPETMIAQLKTLGVAPYAAKRAVDSVTRTGRPVRLVQTPGVRSLTVGYTTETGIMTAAWF